MEEKQEMDAYLKLTNQKLNYPMKNNCGMWSFPIGRETLAKEKRDEILLKKCVETADYSSGCSAPCSTQSFDHSLLGPKELMREIWILL